MLSTVRAMPWARCAEGGDTALFVSYWLSAHLTGKRSHHLCWNLFHFCSRSPWSWVKLVNKEAWKFVLLDKFHCFLKILICFSRKTTDNIGSNSYSRHSRKQDKDVQSWLQSTITLFPWHFKYHYSFKNWILFLWKGHLQIDLKSPKF